MHPIVVIAAAATGLVAGLRLAKQLNAKSRMRDATKKARAAENKSDGSEPRNLGELKPDPQTGVYHPRQS